LELFFHIKLFFGFESSASFENASSPSALLLPEPLFGISYKSKKFHFVHNEILSYIQFPDDKKLRWKVVLTQHEVSH